MINKRNPIDFASLLPEHLEEVSLWKLLAKAGRQLAELKGLADSIPNQSILISTLGLQEAKDSSEIEKIVTTHDEIFRDDIFPQSSRNHATKEVQGYRQGLMMGFTEVKKHGLITNNTILSIQAKVERNRAGFRTTPGTTLQDGSGKVIYTPPQHPDEVIALMGQLESFINAPDGEGVWGDTDPLIKMALIHHQFETIHPFYDGNGRTGRIINVLYLVKTGLLNIPVLYLSRFILQNKSDYYRYLQTVRQSGQAEDWQAWVRYILSGVAQCAEEAIATVQLIRATLMETKHRIRNELKNMYSQDLINHLFVHPYTRIDLLADKLNISRQTASNYLNTLTEKKIFNRLRMGTAYYYVNIALMKILMNNTKQRLT